MPLANTHRAPFRNEVGDWTFADQEISGAKYPGVLVCDASGNILGTPSNPLRADGAVDHDAVNTAATMQIGGHATDVRAGQASVAVGDRVRAALDPQGVLFVRNRQATMYSAVYRLTARPYPLSFAMTANSRKQFATIYHAATATKILRLRRVKVAIMSSSAAALIHVDLVRLTSATTPATPNPSITAVSHDPGDGGSEASTMALPTTGGAEAAGSVFATEHFNTGITGAAPTTNPPTRTSNWVTLYHSDIADLDDALLVPANTAGGFAVVVDSSAASTITALVVIDFTENVI